MPFARTLPVIIVTVFVAGFLTGCMGSPFGEGLGCSGAVDAHEPNDGPEQATPLRSGETVKAVIADGDSVDDLDVYACPVPETGPGSCFVLRIESTRARHLQVQVGASIPGVWEAISWPGWQTVRDEERIVIEGCVERGTVLVFVSGDRRAEYSLQMTWQD